VAYTIVVEVDEEFVAGVDVDAIEAAAAAVLRAEGMDDGDLAVFITSDEEVRALNLEWRGIDAPTDVLSFATHDTTEYQEVIRNAPPDLQALFARALGDVLIAYPYAERQATRFGNSTANELLLLTVHGVLHLLGYDHATPEDEAAMWQRQEEILAAYGVTGLSLRRYEEE